MTKYELVKERLPCKKTDPLYLSLNCGSLHFRSQKDLFIYYSCRIDKAFLNLDFPKNCLNFCYNLHGHLQILDILYGSRSVVSNFVDHQIKVDHTGC